MTKLELTPLELTPAITLLQKLPLKKQASRDRSKLVKLLSTALDSFSADEIDLFKQYCELDEHGELVQDEGGHYKPLPDKREELNAEHQKMLSDPLTIEGGLYTHNIDRVPAILEKIDIDLSNQDAEIYDRLLDEFEANDTKNTDTQDAADEAKED